MPEQNTPPLDRFIGTTVIIKDVKVLHYSVPVNNQLKQGKVPYTTLTTEQKAVYDAFVALVQTFVNQ